MVLTLGHAMSGNDWAVFRQDFSGNEFLVEQGLTEERANELVAEFESHKHHQHYWARRVPKPSSPHTRMLDDLLRNGSSLDASLQVLKSQSASIVQCVRAVIDVRGLDLSESVRAVIQSPAFSDQHIEQDALIEQLENEFGNED